jgi:hypothetical protein
VAAASLTCAAAATQAFNAACMHVAAAATLLSHALRCGLQARNSLCFAALCSPHICRL